MKRKLPKFLKKYFWDVKFEKVDPVENRVYVLKRILEYGDEKAVRWMWKNFKKPQIKDALCNYRGYTQKSANFWAFILGIPKEEVLCLKRRLLKEPGTIWPY